MKSRRLLLIFAMALVLVGLGLSPLLAKPGETLPILGEAPSFELTDQGGAVFSTASLEGRLWVVDFMFTSCPGICPIMTANMARLQREHASAPDLHFVSITVDPEHDTPEVLAEFAEQYGADTTRWHFLTGDLAVIQDLSYGGFKLGSVDVPSMHSGRFVLVDRGGQIRGYYDGTDDAEIDALSQDLALLL
jgi:protein SCO1